MAYASLILSVFEHVNPNDTADPGIGFWVCSQPNIPSAVPTPVSSDLLTAAGVTTTQPFATKAAAQAALQAIAAYEAGQMATKVVGTPGSADAMVYGPFTT